MKRWSVIKLYTVNSQKYFLGASTSLTADPVGVGITGEDITV